MYKRQDEDGLSIEEAFANLDKDNNGVLTDDENISQSFINEMDKDGDGKASFAEYKFHLWSNVK